MATARLLIPDGGSQAATPFNERKVPGKKGPVSRSASGGTESPLDPVDPPARFSGPGNRNIRRLTVFGGRLKWRGVAGQIFLLNRVPVLQMGKRGFAISKPTTSGGNTTKGDDNPRNAAIWSTISLEAYTPPPKLLPVK